jgi:tetratricopeptide (TPR) repeat protein
MRGRVLLELGWISEAESEVANALAKNPDDVDALSLFAKIKHVRGELTEAIGCWARIHAGSPHTEHVIMHLGTLLSAIQDPSVEVRPSTHELEEALSLVADRRFAEARGVCEALASRHRTRDPQRYKVAVIASAWIAELTGDLEAACERLESLGGERGFEHDLDRLLGLARLYEQLERAEGAARIYGHLMRDLEQRGIEKISLYSKLAALERRAGRDATAFDLEARFLAGVRRRMHRPSLHEVVQIAAAEYLPLSRLRRARGAEVDAATLTRRERALVHAMRGEERQARLLFADGCEPIDRFYLGELAAQTGDEERAIELFVGALEHGPEDPHVIGWLLDLHAIRPSPVIAAYWSTPERRRRSLDLLDATRRVTPLEPAVWRQLATLHRLDGNPDEAVAYESHASVLTEAAVTRAMPIGRVLAASVYHFIGKAKGLLHEVWARREPVERGHGGALAVDDIHGNLTPELRGAIRNTFMAVREYALAKFPHATTDIDDYRYSYKLPKEDEPSSGVSAGLPSALAFLSVFLQQPVSREIASSGALITEAHDVITIGRIGEADYKVRAAYHGNLRMLILPVANRVDLEHSTIVPREISAEVVRYATDLDQAVQLVFGPDALTRP